MNHFGINVDVGWKFFDLFFIRKTQCLVTKTCKNIVFSYSPDSKYVEKRNDRSAMF